MPCASHRWHRGVVPLHRAFLAWQFRHAWRTRRLGGLWPAALGESRVPAGPPPKPESSSNEHEKPRRWQLPQTPRRPSQRTFLARQVMHVAEMREDGLILAAVVPYATWDAISDGAVIRGANCRD